VAPGNGVPATTFAPWILNMQAAPMLDAVKVEEEEAVVTGPGIGVLDHPGVTLAARHGAQPYNFMDAVGPSAPPAAALPLPRYILDPRAGMVATPAPAAASSAATRAKATARMKA
jgi:hypothetical protein